jgi:hypothetical protein
MISSCISVVFVYVLFDLRASPFARKNKFHFYFKMSYSYFLAVFHYLSNEHYRLGRLSNDSWLRGDYGMIIDCVVYAFSAFCILDFSVRTVIHF